MMVRTVGRGWNSAIGRR
ncbi:hypothetical protein BDFB_008324 [Asbolus verrucosus]|uniref:Uncharacterized protein n=1 Tax=Asbolus verrucosus TaxID=1661398 RepID=A0A482WAN9_ASBVE|nr:hypothetical protein BDFB_008324 [Asbolus verrucosus]